MSPSETGHSLPSHLCKSENIIIVHGNGKESTEGKLPSQNAVAKQDEWETTVLSTFLGMSTPWMSTGAWKSPALIFVRVCFLDVDSPSCFSETGSGVDVSAAFWLREAGGEFFLM